MTKNIKYLHLKHSELTMLQMSYEDFKIVRNWCVDENWDLGLYDFNIYYNIDPYAHIIFFDDKKLVGSISITKYDDDLFSLGPFIISKEYRGKGYSKAIWNKAIMSRMANYPKASILLYSVIKQVNLYKQHGFKSQYKNIRWNLRRQKHLTITNKCDPLTSELISKICKYDREIFSASREKILLTALRYPDIKGLFFQDDNIIKGYGLIRPCISGFRVGPLLADNLEVARCILVELLEYSGSKNVIIDIPDTNEDGQALMIEFNANRDEQFDTIAMLKSGSFIKYKPDMRKNYGIFSLEIG